MISSSHMEKKGERHASLFLASKNPANVVAQKTIFTVEMDSSMTRRISSASGFPAIHEQSGTFIRDYICGEFRSQF